IAQIESRNIPESKGLYCGPFDSISHHVGRPAAVHDINAVFIVGSPLRPETKGVSFRATHVQPSLSLLANITGKDAYPLAGRLGDLLERACGAADGCLVATG